LYANKIRIEKDDTSDKISENDVGTLSKKSVKMEFTFISEMMLLITVLQVLMWEKNVIWFQNKWVNRSMSETL
jgi:hypothetical protein